MNSEIIFKYFPSLSEHQREQFEKMGDLYREWNAKINVVSRKDIDNIYLHHVLHSLAIARFLGDVKSGTTFLDMGTGGGFPGVPLAVVYPDCSFHLVDRIAKKLRVANEIAGTLGIDNITLQHGDIGECHERFDYVVSRAVMRLDALVPLIRKNVSPKSNNKYANGLICLKGGDLSDEIQGVRNYTVVEYPVKEFFSEDFFDSKLLVYVPIAK